MFIPLAIARRYIAAAGDPPALVQNGSVDVGNIDTRNITFGADLTVGNTLVIAFAAAGLFTTTTLEIHDGVTSEAISQTEVYYDATTFTRYYVHVIGTAGLDQLRSICTGWAPGPTAAYEVSGLGSTPTLDNSGAGNLAASTSPDIPIVPTVASAFVAANALGGSTGLNSVTNGTVGHSGGGGGYQHHGCRLITASGSQVIEFNLNSSHAVDYAFVVIAA